MQKNLRALYTCVNALCPAKHELLLKRHMLSVSQAAHRKSREEEIMSKSFARSMNVLRVRFAYLALLMLWLWLDNYECLNDSSLPEIFYPFGSDEGDSVVTPGSSCSGSIEIPYGIFNYKSLYVSLISAKTHGHNV